MKKIFYGLVFISLFYSISLFATDFEITKEENSYIVSGKNYTITLDASNGAITKIISDGADSSITTPDGLWRAKFKGGEYFNSSQALCKASSSSKKITFNYTSDKLDVEVEVSPKKEFCEFQAKLNLKEGELLEFELPAYFRFTPESVDSLVLHRPFPRNIGIRFNSNFFKDNSNNPDSNILSNEFVGVALYKKLFGANVALDREYQKTFSVTKGKDADFWISQEDLAEILKYPYRTTRSFDKLKPDIEILNAPQGTFLGASRLGGKGAIFRIGGWFGYDNREIYYKVITSITKKIAHLAKLEKSKKTKIKLLNFRGFHGEASSLARRFARDGIRFESVDSPQELEDVFRDEKTLLIINPYAEICPNVPNKNPEETIESIRKFVQAGGYWFENEGIPFYKKTTKKAFFTHEGTVPPVFADFFHFVMNGKNIAYYSVQNIKGASFENSEKSFVCSKHLAKGDKNGGYFERPFVRYLKAPESWETPKVRLHFGMDLQNSVDAFCKANGATKKFANKLDAKLRNKFKNAVLFKMNARGLPDTKAIVDVLPAGNIIHLSNYLKGGFDKQYPDHVPPRPEFSTPEEFKAFIAEIRKKGHLFMPYTNNSWWCDHPRGETFELHGEAPLSVGLDGKNYHEVYYGNDGWTTCMWHPAVREANKKIVKDFTEDYPCDILFQDQTGARSSRLDFNKAAGNPNRYTDGFIFQAREDAKKKPLSTEEGWWGVVNEEIQFCGFSNGIYESPHSKVWDSYIWDIYPKNAMCISNLVGAFFHDKVSLSHHDLGKSIETQRQLSVSLGIGFTMIHIPALHTVSRYNTLSFIRWLDRLQKSLVCTYIGEKMNKFEHNWKSLSDTTGEGYIRAEYGDVSIFASIDSKPYKNGDILIAPEGFIAEGKDVCAGHVLEIRGVKASVPCSYLVEKKDDSYKVWIRAQSNSTLIFPLSAKLTSLKLPDGTALEFKQTNEVVEFKMPLDSTKNKYDKIFTELLVETAK